MYVNKKLKKRKASNRTAQSRRYLAKNCVMLHKERVSLIGMLAGKHEMNESLMHGAVGLGVLSDSDTVRMIEGHEEDDFREMQYQRMRELMIVSTALKQKQMEKVLLASCLQYHHSNYLPRVLVEPVLNGPMKFSVNYPVCLSILCS